MVNMILKDLSLLSKRRWWLVGVWIFFLLTAHGIGFQFLIISMIMTVTPIGVDERNRTEPFFVSLPVSRFSIVFARYVYMLLVIAVVVGVTYFSSFLLNLLFPVTFAWVISLKSLLAGQLGVIFFVSPTYPIIFRYSCRLEFDIKVIMLSLMVIFGSMVGLLFILNHLDINLIKVKLIYNYLGAGVIMLGSLGISLLLYKRREF